ncbi:NAD(+) diphosphatase [Paenibacillus wynnii]|uniref:NAD(+) diphosphatase n=1 Tax=Paenibacillus wynnii TaxID=268407 RepID=A0A098MC30_9BACL|nr:NUDIX domain-containing protein [Paenibacillus wynnii]KGE19112.1 NTP pyrophosphohydrolase [Paenibacillus wynnii]
MRHCHECGAKLVDKECNGEGLIPYCEHCDTFRFPIFSTAISTVVLNRDKNRVLLIQQYNRPDYILVAGYIDKGENAEETLIREVKEEVGLEVVSSEYMRTLYFEPSNTLMLNYICVVDSEDLSNVSSEVDKAVWFNLEEAAAAIKKNSLAETFLLSVIKKLS